MKKSLTLLLLLLSLINSSRASNEVTVTYPNTQDVIFNVNSIYPILWDSDNTLPVNSEVEILLSINDGKDYFIKLGTSLNDGIELIKIPSNFSKSSKCRIKVQSVDNQLFNDESDVSFSINSANWVYFLSNADTVKIPQNDLLGKLHISAFHMQPFIKTTYVLGELSYYYPFCHTSLTEPRGCDFFGGVLKKQTFNFVVSKSGAYFISHTTLNNNRLSNTINIFRGGGISCDYLIRSSLHKITRDYTTIPHYFTSFLVNLNQGEVYTLHVFNDLDYDTVSGNIEMSSSANAATVRNAQTYIAQPIQPNLLKTFIAIDDSLVIRKIDSESNFEDLQIGNYKIIGLAFSEGLDVNTFVNQKITDISFSNLNIAITENIKILEVTPKCPQNLSLTNVFHGTLKEAVLDNITSTQQVINSSNINYQAGKSIILEPGFFINRPNLFKAEIKTCQ